MPRPLITADIRAAVDASFRQMLAVGGIRTDIFEYSLTDFLNHGTVQPAMVYVETTGSDTNGDLDKDFAAKDAQLVLEKQQWELAKAASAEALTAERHRLYSSALIPVAYKPNPSTHVCASTCTPFRFV
jgi:hypothetical protein